MQGKALAINLVGSGQPLEVLFLKNIFILFLIFGCTGSSLLRAGFL